MISYKTSYISFISYLLILFFFFSVIDKPKYVAQTTQNLPETDPTKRVPYLEEVEITEEKFGRKQQKNHELNTYLEKHSKNFQGTLYDMVNSEKNHKQNSFMTAKGTMDKNCNLILVLAMFFCILCLL